MRLSALLLLCASAVSLEMTAPSFTEAAEACEATKLANAGSATSTTVLADGLIFNGHAGTADSWETSQVSDQLLYTYQGACESTNDGKNREDGIHTSSGVLAKYKSSYRTHTNAASLKPATCVQDGFFEVVVKFTDYNNSRWDRMGRAGIMMRVDSTVDDWKSTSNGIWSRGYYCAINGGSGQVEIGKGDNNWVHPKYLAGKYKCGPTCTCSDETNCDQFNLVEQAENDDQGNYNRQGSTDKIRWGLNRGDEHTLRLEVNSVGDTAVVTCYLNNTLIVSKTDSSPSLTEGADNCAFGLTTVDSDVATFRVLDFTGYVAPAPVVPAPVLPAIVAGTVSFEIKVADLDVADVQTNLVAYAQALADTLGIDVDRITLEIVTRPAVRRLVEGDTGVTIIATVTASDTDTATATAVETAVTAPTFAANMTLQLQNMGLTAALTINTTTVTATAAATCSVTCALAPTTINSVVHNLLQVTHDTTSQHTHHQCYIDSASQACICKCCNDASSNCNDMSNYQL